MFENVFLSLAGLVGVVPVVTEFIKKLFNGKLNGTWSQVVSWVVGILVCVFAWVFDLGVLANAEWYEALIVGLAVSLTANGVFDIEVVKLVLQLIFKTKKTE